MMLPLHVERNIPTPTGAWVEYDGKTRTLDDWFTHNVKSGLAQKIFDQQSEVARFYLLTGQCGHIGDNDIIV